MGHQGGGGPMHRDGGRALITEVAQALHNQQPQFRFLAFSKIFQRKASIVQCLYSIQFKKSLIVDDDELKLQKIEQEYSMPL